MKKKVLVVLLFVVMSGCASNPYKFVSEKNSLLNPVEGISILHPVEIERSGVKAVTIITGIMDPALLTEIFMGGGVYPALAHKPDGKDLKGYSVLVGITPWGDFISQYVFAYEQSELEGAQILSFNRDGGFLYRLDGKEAIIIEDGKRKFFNPKRFDKDQKYRDELFRVHGMNLGDVRQFWRDYLDKKLIHYWTYKEKLFVKELRIGSPEWIEYKRYLLKLMPYKYKMGNGEIRISYLPKDEFVAIATQLPGFNGSQRFVKKAKLPLIGLPFMGAGTAVMATASVVGDAVTATVDDSWEGFYGRAKARRIELAPAFRYVCAQYKRLLSERDKKIYKILDQ